MTMVAYVDMRRGNGKVNRCISYAIQGCCAEENTIEAATRGGFYRWWQEEEHSSNGRT